MNDSVQISEWKRATACWMSRFTSLIVGLKWTSNPDLIEALSCSWLEILINDFESDYNFSWHLLNIFVARTRLYRCTGSLGKWLLKRSSTDMQAMGYEQKSLNMFDMLSVEEIELEMEKWKYETTDILDAEPSRSLCPAEALICRTEQIIMKLGYE